MGVLYTVYVVSQLPEEGRDFFEDRFGAALPKPAFGRYPTESELRSVLDAVPGCSVRYAELSHGFSAIVKRVGETDAETTLVAPRADAGSDSIGFYFEGGQVPLIVAIVQQVASRVGALLVCPDDTRSMVLCEPEGAAQRYAARAAR